MSASPTQDSRSEQSAEQRRRKRREKAAKARSPEPKNIVSGAGQPLDAGVRRDLEEQLGHDLSRVRLHTGPEAGQLTELLGADAVAVGQDVFFREGAYRPGTTDGQRLLAHELLHTVQNPHGLGALRAGRELGAVSLPQQAIEQEAESVAQDLARPEAAGNGRSAPGAPELEAGHATPGWLRYATVDADRNRLEQIDPATMLDRLANSVVRSLRADPEDLSKRTRQQLVRLPEELLDRVLERLEDRLLGSEQDKVLDLVEEIEADAALGGDAERPPLDAPAVEPDAAAELRQERESEQRSAEEEQAREERPALAPGPEKDRAEAENAPGSTPQNGGTAESGSTPQGGGAPRGRQETAGAGGRKPEAAGGQEGAPAASQEQPGQAEGPGAATSEPAGASAGAAEQAREQKSEGSGAGAQEGKQDGGGDKKGGQGQQGAEGKEETSQQGAAAASKEESAARNRPGAAEQLTAGQKPKQEDKGGKEKPAGPAAAAGKDTELPGRTSRLDGVRNQDLEGPEETAEDDPFGSGSESEVDVGGADKSAWDVKLQPEDFLPEQDPDVSGVPTADQLDPSSSGGQSVPSFPAPPVTRADKVQAERDAEDAEDETAELQPEETDAAAPTAPDPSVETEGGPGDSLLGGLEAGRDAASRPGPGTPSKDPKSGDDPKAGPVAAQKTVQEAPGNSEGGGAEKETAAKEEQNTRAAGDKDQGAQEKQSQKAAGGTAAAPETAGKGEPKQPDTASKGSATPGQAQEGATGSASGEEPSADVKSPSPARDTHVTGGSNADTPGGASNEAAGGTQSGAPDAGPARSEDSAAAAASPTKTAETPAPAAPASAPAPKEAPREAPRNAPKASKEAPEPKAAPAPRAPRGGGGGGTAGAGGGGGGGKGSASGKGKKKDSAPAPNLSQVSPEAGLSTASKLKPHKALQAMGGVGGAVDRTVGDEHQQLAAAPPSMQRPAGAPQTLEGKPKADAPAQYSQDPAQKSEAPKDEKAEVKGEKKPEGQIEAEKAEEPGGWDTFKMALGFVGAKIVNGVTSLFGADEPVVDPQELAAKFAGLPTKDEALKQAQAGNAPGVEMQGAAEQTAGEQGAAVDSKGQETVATGKDDAARPMGENQVYPNAPKEQLKGKVPGQQGGGNGGVPGAEGAGTGAVPAEAASEVAEHDRGPEFQRAFTQGQKGMSEGRQAKDRDFRDSQHKHKQKVDSEVGKNTDAQAGERGKALDEVTSQRAGWRTEQDEELKKLGTKKTEKHEKVRKDVREREKKTDDDVEQEKKDSDTKIQEKATTAESDAKNKTDTAAKESGNWVTKAFEWLKEKVIEIKNAIVRIIRAARDAVVGFIKNFKENAERWINEARRFIVDTVKNLINDLIEFAKAMVRAVIELANRIRKFITDLIAAAIAFVTKLAAQLKQIVSDLLDAIAKLLSDILNILKKMLMDVIKAVVDAVKTVLDYASKLLAGLGEFMMIAVDFLSDPGGWLSGAKNSAVDGAKNHLFREVQAAVKSWFQSKIEEIIGVPRAILDKLIKGGYTLEKIVKETWDAIVPQLPFIIGEIVITKVIAKLIPGAGWVMAVIDAIRTAIGALGEILRAIGAVLDWLKAVRQGGAGVLFAKAVAAGIVALLELAYEALLSGIGKYVAKVGRRLKGVAAKLGKPDKGGDRPQPARGDDPKPADTKPARPASTDTLPKPGRATGPGTRPNAKPEPKADPNKPTTKTPAKDQATTPTPGKPGPDKPVDTRKPTAPDAPARRKTDKDPDTKPDTRPTPAPKPKPEPRPKPKPEPDTKPKPKDDTPGRPRDDRDTTKPNDDGQAPRRDKDQDPKRPKDQDTDRPRKDQDPAKPKPDKPADQDAPRRRPNKPGDGDGRKPERDKDNDGRPRGKDPDRLKQERQQKKDDRKRQEDSKESKEDRLRKIVARIRPRIEGKLREGIASDDHAALLEQFRAWYRLTRLFKAGGENFSVRAVLNPEMEAADGVTEDGVDRDKPLEFPEPDDRGNFKDGAMPTGFKHDFINKKWSRGGQYPPGKDARLGIIGFRHLLAKDDDGEDLREPRGFFQWDAMHLLPRELGGPAAGSNFVPAYNHINRNFYSSFEEKAAKAFGQISDGKKPGYYQIDLSLFQGAAEQYEDGVYPPGFPRTLQARWATYEHKGHGTGQNRSEWKAESEVVSPVLNQFPEPPTTKRPLVDVNTDRDTTNLRAAFAGTNDDLVLVVFKLRPFASVEDMQERIGEYITRQTGKPLDRKYLNRMKKNFNRIFTLS
ncbi:eCIS core domain-containing protein [Streptomyces afghaniensis]|uniref:eCIS core domain-containing protein n=1 Tax=Streptomyces afghaniensis TaxID=66865 RepID=UPI00378CB1C9